MLESLSMSAQLSDISDRFSNLLLVSILGALLEKEFGFLEDVEERMNSSSSFTLFFRLLAVTNFGIGFFGEVTEFNIGGG